MPYDHSALQREIDNYQDTVWAIVAFVNECQWNVSQRRVDESVPYGIGKTMRRGADSQEVTPDAVVQKFDTQGIVAEVKHTFPPESEEDRRDEILGQLQKYDDDLHGWWCSAPL